MYLLVVSFCEGLHARLGQGSVVRVLGCMRGDKDSDITFDVERCPELSQSC